MRKMVQHELEMGSIRSQENLEAYFESLQDALQTLRQVPYDIFVRTMQLKSVEEK